MIQVLDSTAPFNFFAKNGYYQIGNTVALHAGPAYQEASRTKLPITWNFNNDVYNNLNWRTRLNLPITDLYKLRAQQLRDKYDYLILWFSGGADSTVILESFLCNNIHLDEIMIVWPKTLTVGKYTPSYNTDSSNFISEWELSIEPKLAWVAKHYPRVRITVIDQFVDTPTVEDFEDTWTLVEKHNYPSVTRQRLADDLLKQRYKTHNNIACIAGNAPPMVAVVNNSWLAVYFDNASASGANAKSDYMLDGTPRNVEYFYWSPDLPELVREQGHIILDHLNANPQDKELFTQYRSKQNTVLPDQFVGHVREARRQLIKKLVYPTWNPSTFQAIKPQDTYNQPEHFSWFFNNPESDQFLQSWRSAINSQYNLISDRTFFAPRDGINYFSTFLSKLYVIGKI